MEPAAKRKRTHAFQDSWKKGQPWLDYDHASLSMSCALCKTHFQRKTSGGEFGRDAWLKGKNSLLRIIGMLLGSVLAFDIRSSNRLVCTGLNTTATAPAAAAVATPSVLQSAEAFQQMVQQMPVGLPMQVMQWQQAATPQGAAGTHTHTHTHTPGPGIHCHVGHVFLVERDGDERRHERW